MKCKRYKAKPLTIESCPLPEDRVSDTMAFEVRGVDLARPIFLRNGSKVWIVLFTCAVYRVVHLEFVASLTTDSFLMAFRRFIASRASWWEGFWERLVRAIKELLRRSLGKLILSFEELGTVLCECESVINSRPLTCVSENLDDLVPLTPSMFLIENRNSSTGHIDLVETQSFKKRIKFRTKLLKDLRLRFRKEYLSLLISKQSRNKNVREPQIGEVVLIGDDGKKLLNWPLAIIMEVLPGRDGKVRAVKVKTQSGVTSRPVQ
ncbi:hypothetical protein AVEN_131389-1 [Araneus ventricosus]|uniref:DUF5641 domain-containing protein n=1 Tax=Araneus ventricosus TaxID=182803 RepID=A0A4Y2IK35_ARAVE|nr:hypothetical protein AVEN_131389-1 [Araneus ventricosus]